MEYWCFTICESAPLRPHGETLQHLIEQVAYADTTALTGWFFAEHHSQPSYSLIPSPHLLIAAASQRARRLRLGTMVSVLPFHHPYRVAEEVRLLDILTGGRFEAGFGRGGMPVEQAAWGIGGDQAKARFDAALSLVIRFLSGEPVTYETPWWTGEDAQVVPDGVSPGHPPLWLTALSEGSARKAATLGLNCHGTVPYPDLDRVSSMVEAYRDTWQTVRPMEKCGRFAVLVNAFVAESNRDADRYGRPFMEDMLDKFRKVLLRMFAAEPPGDPSLSERVSRLTLDDLIERNLVLLGSVDRCADQLEQLRSTGVDAVTAWMPFSHPDLDAADRSLRLFCEEVLPSVEGRPAREAVGG